MDEFFHDIFSASSSSSDWTPSHFPSESTFHVPRMNTSGSAHTLIIVSAPSPAYTPWTKPNTTSYSPSVCAIQSKSGKKVSIIVDWDSGRGEEERSVWVKELPMASPQTVLFGTEVQTEQVRALVEYQQ